jgi:hypothetical protein
MHKINMQSKKILNYRLIVLLCIAFLFQQVSFATIQNSIGFTNQQNRLVQNNYFQQGSTQHNDFQAHLFVEAESEDEDNLHTEQAIKNTSISSDQNFNALHYTVTINTLYLRLASNHQHKVDLPFFMLYHCWKSHLA